MDGFSEVGDRRKELVNDIELCREMGWTFDNIRKLTCFEKNTVIRHINNRRRKLNKASKKRKW